MKVIVDGNNLLGAKGWLAGPGRPVEDFLQRLEVAAARRDWEVVVFFDGPARYLPRESGFLTVRYAAGSPADTRIEKLVYDAADRSGIVVVTQDRTLGDMVLGFGGRVWPVARLEQEMAV